MRLYIVALLAFTFAAVGVSPLLPFTECHNYNLAPETQIKSQQELGFEVIEPVVKVFDISEGTEVGLAVGENLFRDSGESKIFFDRINNILYLDEKVIEFGQVSAVDLAIKPKVDDLVECYKSSNPAREILAILPGGNLGFFRCFVGVIGGRVYHHRDWKPTRRSYDMLVTKNDGTIEIMTIKFINDKDEPGIYDQENRDIANEIKFAVYGQRIVKDGNVNIDAEDFEDELRHLFRFPLFQRDARQIHHGFSDGKGELLDNDNEKAKKAVLGEAVELQLEPLRGLGISDMEREDVYAKWGYANVTENKSISEILPGEYIVDEARDVMVIKFLPGIHPHCAFGLTRDKRLLIIAVPGVTHFQGASVGGLAEELITQGAQDVFLWSNGKDVAVRFPQEGRVVATEGARDRSIEILIITQKRTSP